MAIVVLKSCQRNAAPKILNDPSNAAIPGASEGGYRQPTSTLLDFLHFGVDHVVVRRLGCASIGATMRLLRAAGRCLSCLLGLHVGVHLLTELLADPSAEVSDPSVSRAVADLARERTGTVKDEIIKSVAKRGIPDATILAGDITHFVGSDRIAEMKYKNFTDYRQLYATLLNEWWGFNAAQSERVLGGRFAALPLFG